MSPASASLSTRDPETLARHAAAGGMAPDRVRRILADLAPSLRTLHRAGLAHGDIAPATIGLDEAGRAFLLTPPLEPAANAEHAPRRSGYAAFEQYTDDPDTPCGPWTDIYALSATACALLTGQAPPSALARCVRDEYVPLARRDGADEQDFRAVLDSGLAMDGRARPRDIAAFARALGLDMPDSPAGTRPAVPGDGRDARLGSLEDADGLEATAAGRTGEMPGTMPGGMGSGRGGGEAHAAIGAVGAPVHGEASPPVDLGAGVSYKGRWGAPVNDGVGGPVHPEPDGPVDGEPDGETDGEANGEADGAADGPAGVKAAAALAGGYPGDTWPPGEGGAPVAAPADKPRAHGVALYQEDPDREAAVAAAQYDAAVASIHAPRDGEPERTARGRVPPRARPPARQRPPLLMVLAVVVMVGAVLYVWLRPQPAPGTSVAARGPGSTAAPSAGTGTPAADPRPGGKTQAVAQAGAPSTAPSAFDRANAALGDPGGTGNPGNSATPGNSKGSETLPTPTGATSRPPSNGATTIDVVTGELAAPALDGDGYFNPLPGMAGSGTANHSAAGIGTAANRPTGAGTGGNGTGGNATPDGGNTGASAPRATAAVAPASKAPVPVAVAVRPWGEIIVNGKSRGVSPPLSSLTLAPGKYSITIRNNASPDVHQNLTITAGKSAIISHTFN
ncbi:hypothetical protein [Bordetella bronchialis]|uniref:Protein kinase domain-containing protein n=1 Tax=Bordetella bronchialis TaxID=463025 RepID=A0A193G224_9BORD|nr:hypothetical protein [Bordetella bronchialis]ANN73718.1 hypothetical protein BAU08_22270 [Bordetella bronchialis]